MFTLRPALLAAVILMSAALTASAADWPTWRGDARRSGGTAVPLAGTLYRQWSRQLPATLPAWPIETRLHFDIAYEPIVVGDLLTVGSPNDGSVSAYDVASGELRWQFFTEGPIRFAPAAADGRLYVGSDDGQLYCLNAADGQLRWKSRVAPADFPQRRHLGNGRLISFWPVRGGPVIADGTVYCAAGIWPTQGVFVAAFTADSGQLVWRNDELGRLDAVRLDHNYSEPSALSPQGYLAVANDQLVVPNGRSLPALLDRSTGKLRHYLQGYRNGDCHVSVQPPYAFVGETGMIDLRTGREVGSKWAEAGPTAPKNWAPGQAHLFESPFFPYKLFPGCTWRSVFNDGVIFDFGQGIFAAYDARESKLTDYTTPASLFRPLPARRWDPPKLWSLETGLSAKTPADSVVLQAGKRLYGHAADKLVAVDPPADGQSPQIAWQLPLEGQPAVLIAGADRLFAVTREGQITCFGAEERAETKHALAVQPLPAASPAAQQRASELLQLARVQEGYCVVQGLGNGDLATALLQASPAVKLIAIDSDAGKVLRFRKALVAAGWYGTRAEAFVGDHESLVLPQYLASLMVSESAETLLALPAAAVFEQLRPFGGALCLAVPRDRQAAYERWASDASPTAQREQVGELSVLRRAGALPESSAWTHECADAGRSFFSKDRRVKPPFAMLWYGDGSDYGFWKPKDYGNGIKPQVVGGRGFALQNSTNVLSAYDIYTGRQLWSAKVEKYARYASLADGIYVAANDKCVVYDPVDGRQIGEFRYQGKAGQKETVGELRVSENTILVAAVPAELRRSGQRVATATALVALDRKTGEQLWVQPANDAIGNSTVALGDGKVWYVDTVTIADLAMANRRGETGPIPPATVYCLDERTGKLVWRQEVVYERRKTNAGMFNYAHEDWLAYADSQGTVLVGKLDQAVGISAKDGKEVWRQTLRGQPMVVRDATFVTQYGQPFDTLTGQIAGAVVDIKKAACNYYVGNEFCFFGRDHSASYTDAESGKKHGMYAVRSGCSNSMIAADGLLNVPNFAVGCVCNYPIQTSFALFHLPEAASWLKAADSNRSK